MTDPGSPRILDPVRAHWRAVACFLVAAVVAWVVINSIAALVTLAVGALYLFFRNGGRRKRRSDRANEQRRRQAI